MHRVCVYHVGQEHIGRAAALCGEIIAMMCWERMHFQVDVMAGDGNKAAYLSTPKTPDVQHMKFHYFNFGSAGWSTQLLSLG